MQWEYVLQQSISTNLTPKFVNIKIKNTSLGSKYKQHKILKNSVSLYKKSKIEP